MLENKGAFSVVKMAKMLQVSTSGYKKWEELKMNENLINAHDVKQKVRDFYFSGLRRNGAPKIHQDLLDIGIKISQRTVGRYMKEMGLKTVYSRKYKNTTDSNHNKRIAPNRISRNFKVSEPNKIWVTDITYIRTVAGWLYLCVFIDLFNRKVVGWAVDTNMKTDMVLRAYYNAVKRERPEKGLIIHSDRGSQYASNEFRKALILNKHFRSMSRKGNCWDNAVAESFFKTLKMELIYQEVILNKKHCQNILFEYIEIFYYRKRRHSTLGYLTPEQFSNALSKAA